MWSGRGQILRRSLVGTQCEVPNSCGPLFCEVAVLLATPRGRRLIGAKREEPPGWKEPSGTQPPSCWRRLRTALQKALSSAITIHLPFAFIDHFISINKCILDAQGQDHRVKENYTVSHSLSPLGAVSVIQESDNHQCEGEFWKALLEEVVSEIGFKNHTGVDQVTGSHISMYLFPKVRNHDFLI